MISAIANALTGLNAASRSLAGTAHNVAHYGATARLDDQATAATRFRLFDTVNVSIEGGGVRALQIERDPSAVPLYAPHSRFADPDGMVALANVDLATEIVNSIKSSTMFRANLQTIGTAERMLGALLDDES